MIFLLAKMGYAFASIFFLYGISHRQRNLVHHQRAMALGYAVVTLITLVVLASTLSNPDPRGIPIIVERLAGVELGHQIQNVHLWVALVSYLLLTAQVGSGRLRLTWHKPLARVTGPLWVAVFITGLFLYG